MGPEAGNPNPFSDANNLPELEMTETAQAAEVDSLRTATAEGPVTRTLYGEGLRWRQFIVDGNIQDSVCPTEVDIILTLHADGTAQVETQGIDEHDANCEPTGTLVTVLTAFGSYDILTGVVTITNCYQIGGLSAKGEMLYKGDSLGGGYFQCHDSAGLPAGGLVEMGH
jgi:hypothetical protein